MTQTVTTDGDIVRRAHRAHCRRIRQEHGVQQHTPAFTEIVRTERKTFVVLHNRYEEVGRYRVGKDGRLRRRD